MTPASLRIALGAIFFYFLVVALSIWSTPPSPSFDMIRIWAAEAVLTAICLYVIYRHTGWAGAGFGAMRWRALVWLMPAFLLLTVMWLRLIPALVQVPLTPQQGWALALMVLTTALIGFSEEVMFRGIVLRIALNHMPLAAAIALSALTFAVLHLLGGPVTPLVTHTMQQFVLALLVGIAFAPVALMLGNLWPLIIWHWLWNLVVFASAMMDILHPYAVIGILMQGMVGLWLWLRLLRGRALP